MVDGGETNKFLPQFSEQWIAMRESELRVRPPNPNITPPSLTCIFAARLNPPTAAEDRYLNGSIMRGRLSVSGRLQSLKKKFYLSKAQTFQTSTE